MGLRSNKQRSFWRAVELSIGATLIALSLAGAGRPQQMPPQEQITFDLGNTAQVVDGFGIHHWAGQIEAAREFSALNITHIRITKDWDSWYDMRDLHRRTEKARIKWVYVRWAPPEEFLDREKQLIDVAGFAEDWLNTIQQLNAQSCRPHFIELVNEPDYFGVPPAAYAELAQLVRGKLDAAGYRDIRIVGPGLTHIGKDNFKAYYDFLKGPACAALDTWTTHAWEDARADGSGDVAMIQERGTDFTALCRRRSPDKRIWYTEYATRQTRFHGIKYPHPDYESVNYSASFTMPYAIRVFENTLAILNTGANVPFYWCSADYRDSKKQWGLIGPDGEKKPVYFALKALFGNVAPGSRLVVPPGEMLGKSVYAAAFLNNGPEGGRIVVALANSSAEKRKATIRIENSPPDLAVVKAEAVRVKRRGNPEKKRPDTAELRAGKVILRRNGGAHEFRAVLPRDSGLTVVLGGSLR